MKLTLILLLFLWDNVEFTLTHEECAELPTVEHAFVLDEYKKPQYQIRDVVIFCCDPGYTTGLNTSYVCTEQGWGRVTYGPCVEEGIFPVRLGCTRPPALKNGNILRNTTFVYSDGDTARYQCNQLYILKGGLFKTCSNGQWTGDIHCQEISCFKSPTDNFEVEEEKTEYKIDEVLRYSCHDGFEKVDERPSLCTIVGQFAQWIPMPQCKPQNCTLEDFKQSDLFDEHFDWIFLDQSYNSGSTVRVHCNIGFEGDFKMICINGQWFYRGDKCKAISCGHPGDAQFADFRLVYGNDYVFGSQVEYICHSGYEMTSLRSTRNCLSQGWDGHLPECKPIFCEKPQIDNGTLQEEKEKYEQHEVLSYSCGPGYTKVNREPSVCLKVDSAAAQWSPSPQCEAMACKLSADPPSGTTYSPQNQTIFRPGQTVTVSCGENEWVKSSELQSAELTCQDSGSWDYEPVCQLAKCSKSGEFVYQWESTQSNTVNVGQTLWYRCYGGFEATSRSGRATCSRAGWEPRPLCKELVCPKPTSDNFEVEGEKMVYQRNEVLAYSCNRGYKKVDERPSVCKKVGQSAEWTPAPQCELVTCKLRSNPPEGTTYSAQDQVIFRPGQTVTVSCGEKQWVKSIEHNSAELTCQETGSWDYEPVCQMVTCSRDAENVQQWQSSWHSAVTIDRTLWYRCHEGFEATSPSGKATCTRGGWEPNPLCKGESQ